MTIFQKLKHEARRAEQRSDWARAIDLYRQALDTDEDMADLSLYNRIGDLYMRLGQSDSAVECYERAIERYADNGMHTSAIALCNKILRIAPGRHAVYRRLAGLHARTGLIVEGRSACLSYLRASLEAGSRGEAAEAVEEFVGITGDEQIRLGYAEALAENGDPEGAADQLRAVIRLRNRRGVDAQALVARLETLAPGGGALAAETDAEPATGPAAPMELARLVADRLAEMGAESAFDPDRPSSFVEASGRESDGLDGVRRSLGRFRNGVEDVLAASDLSVRYDLGVEFMTIGLLDEAIEEFQVAVSDPALVVAANARIGECLALRTSGPAFDAKRRSHMVRAEAGASRDAAAQELPEQLGQEDAAEPAPEPESEPAEALGAEGEDELQGHFFRARLAQYRIRRAEERHTTDHAAHLDLGAAYIQMELHQEALRELGVAFEGPRPVSGRAARALKRLALEPGVDAALALSILERLAAADSGAVADTLGAELTEAWGDEHPMSGRLAELRGRLSDALEELPALEDLFPGLGEETRDPEDTAMADGEDVPAPESGAPPDVAASPVSPEAGLEPVLSRAAELVEDGAEEDAVDLLGDALVRYEDEKRTRDALAVLDRLLELRPDDASRHEQRTELAGMVNDSPILLSAFAELGACRRRLGDDRGARSAYGRMLDVDPDDETAREAIARIDADELEAERESEQARMTNGQPSGAAVDEAEVAALLEELDVGDEELEPDDAASPDGADGPGGPDSEGDDPTARSQFELGLAFRQMGMWEEAVRELRPALDGVADRLTVLEALGECLLKAGHPEEAVRLLDSNLRADEDGEQVASLYFFGLALQAEGEVERAKEIFARIEAVRPGYRDAADRLSELSL